MMTFWGRVLGVCTVCALGVCFRMYMPPDQPLRKRNPFKQREQVRNPFKQRLGFPYQAALAGRLY